MEENKGAAHAVEEYVRYRRIVGEDDEGRLFSQAEYEAYKQTVVPSRIRNRLYVSFGVPGGIDCKLVGPETLCFCSHRYKQHQTDFEELPKERPITVPCRVRGCGCQSFQYVQRCGTQAARCCCKHTPSQHSQAAPHLCEKCSVCAGFRSPFTCGCGQPSYAHVTLVETREEREARGLPVGRAVPYAAMGGLTGFSSLAEGYLRLDPSGSGLKAHNRDIPSVHSTGPPTHDALCQAGTDQSKAHNRVYRPQTQTSVEKPERTEEDDGAYAESSYKDKLKKKSVKQEVMQRKPRQPPEWRKC